MALSPWTFGAVSPYSGGVFGYDDPFFSGIERAMDRAFARAVDVGQPLSGTTGSRALVPNLFRTVAGSTPMDITETDKEYTIHADAPGFNPNEVSVEEHDGVLTVRGTKQEQKEDKDKQGNVIRQERVFRSFTRSFTLPETAEAEKIEANLDRGVLSVRVPKKESAAKEPERRRIPIGGGSGPAQVAAAPQASKQAGQ